MPGPEQSIINRGGKPAGQQTGPVSVVIGVCSRRDSAGAIFVLAIVAVMLYFICRAVSRVEDVESAMQAVVPGISVQVLDLLHA